MQVPVALHGCLGIGDDVKSIENWAGILVHPKKLVEQVGESVLRNRKELKTIFGSVKEDWETGKWYEAGKDTAELMTMLLGPVEPVTPYFLQ